MVNKIWKFLTTDVQGLNWSTITEATKTGADAGKAVLDLGKAIREKQGDLVKIQAIAPYVQQISSLLDVLNSPLATVVTEAIPFAPIAVTMLQLIFTATQQEPTLEQCVALISQAAYLESLRELLAEPESEQILDRLNSQASRQVQQSIQEVGKQSLDKSAAERVITSFASTDLANCFNTALMARLMDAGVDAAVAKTWAERVAWNTPKFFNQTLADAQDKAKVLAELFNNGGRETLERYSSIERYLEEKILPLPQEMVFDETDLSYRQIYVSLQTQPLKQDGLKDESKSPTNLEAAILGILAAENPREKSIMFIQGEAGQGKSVFCRMFSDRVRRELFPSFIPILIRLRDLRTLANNLTTTLQTYLQHLDFVQADSGWLTDRNQRFLFLLDGFDELVLQGVVKSGETGGLKEFLDQVVIFQKDSHHRFVITGRPLSLQGIDRLISQSKNLTRLALCPMQDAEREVWMNQWAAKFGDAERNKFVTFLQNSPQDVKENLAREPLLLYLLARMHRDTAISAENLQGTAGLQAKIKIYDAVIQWVLEKQRDDRNVQITGLNCDQLRQFLTEAALCVVQSGNETAKVAMLEARFAKDSKVAEFIKTSRKTADVNEQKALNNLLTTFYIKPAAVDQDGSIEFAHKSFGEFLFAERLKEAVEEWSKPAERKREPYLVSDKVLYEEIYDLLGFGGLSQEVYGYVMQMLEDSQEWQPVTLFERFWFYLSLCDTNAPVLRPLREAAMRRFLSQWSW
jgi:NACHT domain